MALAKFADVTKDIKDMLGDDFDSKYSLKIKSAAPENTTLTTTLTYSSKDSAIVPKSALKWAGPSGFTLDKLEVTNDLRPTVETSLTGIAPGLKLFFKGNDSDKAELSADYKLPNIMVTTSLDILKGSYANMDLVYKHGDILVGAATAMKLKGSTPESTFKGALKYSIPNVTEVAVTATPQTGSYDGLFLYEGINPQIKIGGKVSYEKSGLCGAVVSSYKCNPDTTIKKKLDTKGVLSLSVKQNLPKKLSVVGSATIPLNSGLKGIKYGLNATLG
jgi:hypothetical protein